MSHSCTSFQVPHLDLLVKGQADIWLYINDLMRDRTSLVATPVTHPVLHGITSHTNPNDVAKQSDPDPVTGPIFITWTALRSAPTMQHDFTIIITNNWNYHKPSLGHEKTPGIVHPILNQGFYLLHFYKILLCNLASSNWIWAEESWGDGWIIRQTDHHQALYSHFSVWKLC